MENLLLRSIDYILNRPLPRRVIWQWINNYFAKNINLGPIKFNNYGYIPSIETLPTLPLIDEDKDEKIYFQLYQKLLYQIPVNNKRILDVGCGRGGGVYLLAKYFHCQWITGLDRCHEKVLFCKNKYPFANVSFKTGDAENLPFEENEFDILMNVESSHCYGNMLQFFNEVKRVLKPGGLFLFTDIRTAKDATQLDKQIRDSGLKIKSTENISQGVIKALDLDSDKKSKMIQRVSPKYCHLVFRETIAVKGTRVYQSLVKGDYIYMAYVLANE